MDPRRTSPRIDVEAMCWELVGDREISSLVVDLSSDGARLERPFVGGRIAREVPLQLEIPGIDEVMWARGDVVFDQVVAGPDKGPFGLVRRTGFHNTLAAARDLRLVRDFVYSMYEPEPDNDNEFFAYSLARAYRSR
jgi:hypothetical protein